MEQRFSAMQFAIAQLRIIFQLKLFRSNSERAKKVLQIYESQMKIEDGFRGRHLTTPKRKWQREFISRCHFFYYQPLCLVCNGTC